MGTTLYYQLPYPELSDQPHGPNQLKALADATDTLVKARADRVLTMMSQTDEQIVSDVTHGGFANGAFVTPVTLPAGTWWAVEGFALYSAPLAGDVKIALDATAVMQSCYLAPLATVASDFGIRDARTSTGQGLPLSGGGIGVKLGASFAGYFRTNASSASTVSLTWAQIISDPGATIYYAGSWLRFTRMV